MYFIFFEEEPPTESPEAVESGNPQIEATADTNEGEEAGAINNQVEEEEEEENAIIYESVDYSEHFETLETIGIANCLSVSFLALIVILWKVFKTS